MAPKEFCEICPCFRSICHRQSFPNESLRLSCHKTADICEGALETCLRPHGPRTRRCQFHQHFTWDFYAQKCVTQLLSTYILTLNFFWQNTCTIGSKAAHSMLMKLTKGVNFISIVCTHFCTKVWSKPNLKQRKAAQKTFLQKCASKMLMKLTKGVTSSITLAKQGSSILRRLTRAWMTILLRPHLRQNHFYLSLSTSTARRRVWFPTSFILWSWILVEIGNWSTWR